MHSLPAPSAIFTSKKSKILDALSVPDSDYTDLSPKGSVDKGIRHLIDEVNVIDGLVTTSSCAGRVSVFLEGRKALDAGDEDGEIATPGGKGGGGNWLFVSHDPVVGDGWVGELGLSQDDGSSEAPAGRRLIHFKFEPMVRNISPQN
jgi:tRNA wybutosine-synthesizing protein 3